MDSWNILDKFIGKLRYLHVNKYVKANSCIVDVGCGREAAFLMDHKDKIRKGIGLDYRITDCIDDNITLVNNQGMCQWPIDAESVNTVFLNAVLEHLENPLEILQESKRILVPGGMIVLTTPTRIAKPVLEFMAYKLHIINEEEIREHKHYYNKKDIYKLAEILRVSVYKYGFFELGFNSIIILKK